MSPSTENRPDNFEPRQRRAARVVRWHYMEMASVFDTSVRRPLRESASGRRWVVECALHGQRTEARSYRDASMCATDRSPWCDGEGDEHPEDESSWERIAAEGRLPPPWRPPEAAGRLSGEA